MTQKQHEAALSSILTKLEKVQSTLLRLEDKVHTIELSLIYQKTIDTNNQNSKQSKCIPF